MSDRDAPAIAREAGTLLKAGRTTEAIDRVRREIEAAKGRGEDARALGFLYHLLFSCCFHADDRVSVREALAAWEGACPADAATRLSIADAMYWQLRDRDAAEAKAHEASAMATGSPDTGDPGLADTYHRALYLLGLVAADRGDHDRALAMLEKSHIADWQLPAKLIAAGRGLETCRKVLEAILQSPEGSGPAGVAGPQALTVVRALLRAIAEKTAMGA